MLTLLRFPTITTSLGVVVKSERKSAHSTRKVLVLSRFSCDGGGRYTTARLTKELSITRLHINYSQLHIFHYLFCFDFKTFLVYQCNASSSSAIVSVNSVYANYLAVSHLYMCHHNLNFLAMFRILLQCQNHGYVYSLHRVVELACT